MVVTNAVSIRLLASRLFNQLRCCVSYALSLVGVVRVRHLPTFVSVEPANFCQLHCPECPVGKANRAEERADRTSARRRERLSVDDFVRVLGQVQSTAHTMQFYFQGEPLLNRHLPTMIAMAHNVGLYTIVSTNAQSLTRSMAQQLVQSGLNRIIVSIDGFSQESYASYRVGGDLHRALSGLRFLREAKEQYGSRICIELQVLRLRSNEHEWQWIRRHYRQLGASRLVFKTAQLSDYQHGHVLMPTDLRYSRYRRVADGSYQLHRSWIQRHWHNAPCYRLWSGCVITTSGQLLPCCYDKSANYVFGNLLSDSLSSIWHSKKANDFRQQVLCHRNRLPICRECNQ